MKIYAVHISIDGEIKSENEKEVKKIVNKLLSEFDRSVKFDTSHYQMYVNEKDKPYKLSDEFKVA